MFRKINHLFKVKKQKCKLYQGPKNSKELKKGNQKNCTL